VLGNRKLLYGLLFDAAAATLLEVASDPKHLGARLGVLLVLHTWGQQLEHHPHVHGVVPGGGLACSPDGQLLEPPVWRACRPNFFLPVKVLGRVFRGKYLAGLQQARARGELQFAGSTAALTSGSAWSALVQTLYTTDWVVYAKEPFGGPEQVLKYLTRYTHRVAIGNGRLVRWEEDQVTFTYKDNAQGCAEKELTLAALEFVRRFALHIVPRGLVRLRQYGLLANRGRQARLARCRELLGTAAPPTTCSDPGAEPVGPARFAARALPLLLVILLEWLAEASRLSPAVLAAGIASLVTPWATPEWLCRTCGLGWRETIWRAERPTGRELEAGWEWNTS
jgi:hypothetical protein